MKQFWDKHKVLIMGLLAAIAIAAQPFISSTSEDIKWKAIGTAVGLAVLSYFARQWRGQGMTILGIIGVGADVVYNMINEGTFSWERAAVAIFVAIVFAVAPDPKSRGYEQSGAIIQAKKEGEEINPAQLTAKPK